MTRPGPAQAGEVAAVASAAPVPQAGKPVLAKFLSGVAGLVADVGHEDAPT